MSDKVCRIKRHKGPKGGSRSWVRRTSDKRHRAGASMYGACWAGIFNFLLTKIFLQWMRNISPPPRLQVSTGKKVPPPISFSAQ